MRNTLCLLMASCLLAIWFLPATLIQTAIAAAAPAKVPQGWKFNLPEGDPKAGKTLFLNMKCYSCHAIEVPGEKIPPARSKGAGPALAGYADLPREYLAESIIKFHTTVAAPGYRVKEGRAGMGEYNHLLSVQELIDLVAFLKHGAKGK